MSVRQALGLWLATALTDALGARLLDSLGLIEGLLSPTGARLALLLPLSVLFYAARFVAWFVAPGLALGALTFAGVASFSKHDRCNTPKQLDPGPRLAEEANKIR